MRESQDRVLKDAEEKRRRVREFLEDKQLDGVIITTREHFAWLTSGGDNHVVRNASLGFGAIVITPKDQYLVAHNMDADRLLEEQVKGQDFEQISMHWYEGDIRTKAKELAGKRVGSDTDFPGTANVYADLVDLHYPMTSFEVERIRWLATISDGLFCDIGHAVQPGEMERDIALKLHCAHLQAGLDVDVLIVGSDERCFKYRHPIPTEKPLEKYLMLHTVARRWGLHCNLTRFIHFGNPPERIRKAYDAAANVEARVFCSLNPGVKFADMLTWQKQWYAEQGFADEWRNHFQGGPTGYIIVDAGRCLTPKVVQSNQPFEWFITITGTKTGELALLTDEGLEISSFVHSSWPGMCVETTTGTIEVPDLLIR